MRYLLIFCFLMLVSCSGDKKKDKSSVVVKKDSVVVVTPDIGTPEYFLEYDGEKVILISKVVKLDIITVSKIISDYEEKTTSGFASYSKINEIIDQLANQNNISERVISIIIFMYKYDTLIKEDYEKEIIEDFQDNQTDHSTFDNEVNTGR